MKNELKHTLLALKEGRCILYPTDTVWGLGCDATNVDAVKSIYELKEREESKALICLVNDLEMLRRHISEIPKTVLDIIETAKRPTTIIFDNPIGIAKNLIAKDNTLAIRIVQDEFCKELIKQFGKPIVSTSANISGKPTPKSFKEIAPEIINNVDYVVNLHRDKISDNPSSIIKVSVDGIVEIIRK